MNYTDGIGAHPPGSRRSDGQSGLRATEAIPAQAFDRVDDMPASFDDNTVAHHLVVYPIGDPTSILCRLFPELAVTNATANED